MTELDRVRACMLVLAFCILACAGHEPLGTSAADGGEPDSSTLYEECSGRAGERGSCGEGEICGSLPAVGYNYCLRAFPCPPTMVSVIDLACAYPCARDSDCARHGLGLCADNALSELSDAGAPGWCAP